MWGIRIPRYESRSTERVVRPVALDVQFAGIVVEDQPVGHARELVERHAGLDPAVRVDRDVRDAAEVGDHCAVAFGNPVGAGEAFEVLPDRRGVGRVDCRPAVGHVHAGGPDRSGKALTGALTNPTRAGPNGEHMWGNM